MISLDQRNLCPPALSERQDPAALSVNEDSAALACRRCTHRSLVNLACVYRACTAHSRAAFLSLWHNGPELLNSGSVLYMNSCVGFCPDRAVLCKVLGARWSFHTFIWIHSARGARCGCRGCQNLQLGLGSRRAPPLVAERTSSGGRSVCTCGSTRRQLR